MNTGQKLIKGSMLRSANFLLQVAVAFIMTPFIIHSLGDRLYGFWVLVGSFIGYYGLLDLGLSSATQRYVSRAIGQNDSQEMNNIISSSFFLFLIAGVVVLFISFIAALSCFYFIKNPLEVTLFREVVIILGISVAIGFPMRAFGGILTSSLRYDLSSYASIIRLIISNILIYYFLKIGYGILAIAIISSFASLLEYTLILIFSKVAFPQLKISYSFYRRDKVKSLFVYSSKTFIAQLGDILRFRIDSFVIAGFLNLSLVTYYSVGARLIEYFGQFIISSVGIMSPVFSQYEGRGDYEALRKSFLTATRISVILSVFIGASIIYYGKVFIQRWVGPGFESSYYVALILCIPYIIALMQTPAIGLLYGISKHQYFAVANTCEGLLNLMLSIILIRFYGIYGVALGTAIEMIIFKLFIQPIYTCHAINLSIYGYYFKILLLTAIKTLTPLLLYFYLMKDFLKANYINILISSGIQIMFFIPIAFFFVLSKQERRLIKN